MRSWKWTALAVALALLVSGCGSTGGSDRDADRQGAEQRFEREPIGRAEAEHFAAIKLPSGLDDLEASRFPGPQDESIAMRFTIPRSQVNSMRSILSEPLEEGYRAVIDRPELGWKIEDSQRFLGASDVVDGVGRDVLVDLDAPGRPVVYLTAGTVG